MQLQPTEVAIFKMKHRSANPQNISTKYIRTHKYIAEQSCELMRLLQCVHCHNTVSSWYDIPSITPIRWTTGDTHRSLDIMTCICMFVSNQHQDKWGRPN